MLCIEDDNNAELSSFRSYILYKMYINRFAEIFEEILEGYKKWDNMYIYIRRQPSTEYKFPYLR